MNCVEYLSKTVLPAIGKTGYVFIVNKPPAPGIGCKMVNITENEGEWTYGIEEGIMTQTDFSYKCDRTCVDETNDPFTLTTQYVMVESAGTQPSATATFTPIGTSGKMGLRKETENRCPIVERIERISVNIFNKVSYVNLKVKHNGSSRLFSNILLAKRIQIEYFIDALLLKGLFGLRSAPEQKVRLTQFIVDCL